MKLNTYINFGGNCAEAFRFYEKHLGGKITMMMTFGDNPDAAKAHPNAKDLILHAAMQIGGTVLMASDAVGEKYQPMRSAYLSLGVDSSEEAERVHAALADGGEIFMPMAETFFAHRFSMLRDKFGVNWMIIHQRPAPPNS
jgi:PhnB protein